MATLEFSLATIEDRAAASNTNALPADVPFAAMVTAHAIEDRADASNAHALLAAIGDEPMPEPQQLPKTPAGDKLVLFCKLCGNIYHVAI